MFNMSFFLSFFLSSFQLCFVCLFGGNYPVFVFDTLLNCCLLLQNDTVSSIESHPEFLDDVLNVVNKDQVHRRLFVRGVGYDTTEEAVRREFSQYGELEECTMIMDRQTGKSKGYGFVSINDAILQ